jgi:hypothetical protein
MRHLGEALDSVRKSEYARLSGRQRRYIKGQKYTLLSRRANLSVSGKRALKPLLNAKKRLNTAYLLKESFGQPWDYEHEGWAHCPRQFFNAHAASRAINAPRQFFPPVGAGAGHLLGADHIATSRLQRRSLDRQVLINGRNARISVEHGNPPPQMSQNRI